MKTILQHAKVITIRRQIVQYNCDDCGAICGTRENPKKTYYRAGGGEIHRCLKTCRLRRPGE